MAELYIFILVRTNPLLGFITRGLEDVPWWTILCLS